GDRVTRPVAHGGDARRPVVPERPAGPGREGAVVPVVVGVVAGVEQVVAPRDARVEAAHAPLVEVARGGGRDYGRRRGVVGRAGEDLEGRGADDPVRVPGRVGAQRLVVRVGAVGD